MNFGDLLFLFFFQAEDGIRDSSVTGVQTCALPILDFIWKGTAGPQVGQNTVWYGSDGNGGVFLYADNNHDGIADLKIQLANTTVLDKTDIIGLDITAPTVASVVASGIGIDVGGNGDLNAPHVVTLTVNMSEVVTVNTAGGTHIPTLSLNDGGTATYTGGSGGNALTFSYTVAAGQNTADLTVTSFNAAGAVITDGAGNAAIMTGAVTNPAGTLTIDTTAAAPSAPDLTALTDSGSSNTDNITNVTRSEDRREGDEGR